MDFHDQSFGGKTVKKTHLRQASAESGNFECLQVNKKIRVKQWLGRKSKNNLSSLLNCTVFTQHTNNSCKSTAG